MLGLPQWVGDWASAAQGITALIAILAGIATVFAVAVRWALRPALAKIHARIDDHMEREEAAADAMKEEISSMKNDIAYIAGALRLNDAPSHLRG